MKIVTEFAVMTPKPYRYLTAAHDENKKAKDTKIVSTKENLILKNINIV